MQEGRGDNKIFSFLFRFPPRLVIGSLMQTSHHAHMDSAIKLRKIHEYGKEIRVESFVEHFASSKPHVFSFSIDPDLSGARFSNLIIWTAHQRTDHPRLGIEAIELINSFATVTSLIDYR